MTTKSSRSAGADSFLALANADIPIRVPSATKVSKAAWELVSKWRWEVKRCVFPAGEFVVTGRDIEKHVYAPSRPPGAREMDVARWIVVRALVAKAEALTPTIVEEICGDMEPDEIIPREYAVLQRCKEHLQAQVAAMAMHGGSGSDGRLLAGPEALLNLVGVPVTVGGAAGSTA